MTLTLALTAWAGNTVRLAVQERINAEPRNFLQRERVLSVNVVTVTPQTIAPKLVVFGELSSTNTFDVRALSSGTVLEVSPNFINGGRVELDELIIKIDPRDAQSSRDRTAADLRDAQSEVRDADSALIIELDEIAAANHQVNLRQQALTRQTKLVERGVGTAAAVEAAQLALSGAGQAVLSRRQAQAQSQARLDQATTALDRAHLNLADADRAIEDTEIRAPFSGTLAQVNISQGERVTENERLGELIEKNELEVAFRLSTIQYARLTDINRNLDDAAITVKLEVQDLTLTASGKITRESANVGEGRTGRLLFARLENAVGLRPGDFVTVTVTEPLLRDVARVPSSAIGSGSSALLLSEGNRLEEVAVVVLRRQGDDVIISAPTLYGHQIIAERSPLLGAGIAVQPIDPNGKAIAPEPPEMTTLNDDRRARLIAFVKASRMPLTVQARIVDQLEQNEVLADVIKDLESRIGT